MNLDTYQTYTYDSTKHRLTKIRREATTESAEAYYDDSDGRVTKVVYGNGSRAEYGYNGSEALTKLSHFSQGGTVIDGRAYEYDRHAP